jgi:murein DD-endopeptidase MepM/ murein hydrolase activator NlpD
MLLNIRKYIILLNFLSFLLLSFIGIFSYIGCSYLNNDLITRSYRVIYPTVPLPENILGTLMTYKHTFCKNDTLSKVLHTVGVPDEQIQDIVVKAKPLHSLTRFKTGESIHIVFNKSTQEIVVFKHQIDFKSMLFIQKDGDDLKAQILDIPHDKSIKTVTSAIHNSLYEEGLRAGLSPKKILELTDIFPWDIDFFTGLQKGDTFSVVFEVSSRSGTVVSEGNILAAQITKNGKLYQAFYYEVSKGNGSYFDEKGRSLQKQFLKSPLRFSRISSGFSKSRFHPILKKYHPHLGIDYVAPHGTPIEAIAEGMVSFVGWKNGYGNFIEIKHSSNYTSSYGHLSRYARGLKKGRRVTQGQVIGHVGATGLATGAHLDFRMCKSGRFINPLTIKNIESQRLTVAKMNDFKRTIELRLAQLSNTSENKQYLVHSGMTLSKTIH